MDFQFFWLILVTGNKVWVVKASLFIRNLLIISTCVVSVNFCHGVHVWKPGDDDDDDDNDADDDAIFVL